MAGRKAYREGWGAVIVMSTHCLIKKRFSCWQIRLKEAGKSKDPTTYVDICVLSILNPDGIFFISAVFLHFQIIKFSFVGRWDTDLCGFNVKIFVSDCCVCPT